MHAGAQAGRCARGSTRSPCRCLPTQPAPILRPVTLAFLDPRFCRRPGRPAARAAAVAARGGAPRRRRPCRCVCHRGLRTSLCHRSCGRRRVRDAARHGATLAAERDRGGARVGRRAGAGAAGQADGDIAAVTERRLPLNET
eukprot:17411-Chlamydomonas_euryale.AAC.1